MATANRPSPSVFSIPNIRWFIFFRIFFNARFYYPVFSILFLDFGLTLSQFALLNSLWAATIVLMEVPSGALADIIGRKRLVVAAAGIMVVEIGLICVVPRSHPTLLLVAFCINRILSGMAEAAASGADEALAYDSLPEGHADQIWPRVLAIQARARAAAFIIAMIIGAAVYDRMFLQSVVNWLGMNVTVHAEVALRLPLVLTLFMSVLALASALKMKESKSSEISAPPDFDTPAGKDNVIAACRMTGRAAHWIWSTPFAFSVILCGLFFDGINRMMLTVSSQYYRLIEIPEAMFGLVSAAMALLGFVVPWLAAQMAQHRSPLFNLLTMSLLALIGMVGLIPLIPFGGVAFMAMLTSGIYLLNFFASFYLNQLASPQMRATVLSFKGLAFNLAYGLVGGLYAVWLQHLRGTIPASDHIDDRLLVASLPWLPVVFVTGMVLILLIVLWRMRHQPKWTPAKPTD